MTQEFGYRPYVSNKPYAEQQKLYTDYGVALKVITRHSEFKKPYLWPEYQEMEYWWDPGGDISFYYPGFDYPWMGYPLPDLGESSNPCNHYFWCDTSDMCYCPGETLCWDVPCSYPIVGVAFHWFSDYPEYYSLSFGEGGTICISSADPDTFSPGIVITLKSSCNGVPVYGTYPGLGESVIGECSDCCVDDDYELPEWGTGSIETIGRNDSGIVELKADDYFGNYGLAPFTWSITGTGFSLSVEKTTGKSNVVVTNGVACGSATVTVTDRCGNVVEGYIKCTSGQWVEISDEGQSASSIGCYLCWGANSGWVYSGNHRYWGDYVGGHGYIDEMCGQDPDSPQYPYYVWLMANKIISVPDVMYWPCTNMYTAALKAAFLAQFPDGTVPTHSWKVIYGCCRLKTEQWQC